MKKLILLALILIIGCNVNDKKTIDKPHTNIKNVKSNNVYAKLVLKDTISLTGKSPLIGQILPHMSKVSNNGEIYLYDRKKSIFFEYNKEGKFVGIIGKNGPGPGEYLNPSDIFIDEKNYKYIFETSRFTTIVLDSHNRFVREYKYDTGFPFPGQLLINDSFKVIALTNFGKNRYKDVEYFHILDNKFKIIKSSKIDFPNEYNKYDLMGIAYPIWDINKKNIFLSFPATNSIYVYDINFSLKEIWNLNSHYFKKVDMKLDRTLPIPKKRLFYSSFSQSTFLKIIKNKYLFYCYKSEFLNKSKSLNSNQTKNIYYFNVFTTNGVALNLNMSNLPGEILDVTKNGTIYLLINNDPYEPVIGIYEIENIK